jgi:hypothetical protein
MQNAIPYTVDFIQFCQNMPATVEFHSKAFKELDVKLSYLQVATRLFFKSRIYTPSVVQVRAGEIGSVRRQEGR